MKGFSRVFRGLVWGPALRHPMRVVLPAAGVAIGVAAVAAIHHANRSVTESFREAASTVSGRSDFVVRGAAGIPVRDLAALSFLWSFARFAPAVSGPAVLADGSGEVLQVLGVDWGGDAAVRDFRLAGPGADSPSQRARILASTGSVLVTAPFAARRRLSAGGTLPIVAGGVRREPRIGGLLELSGVARASGGDLILTDLFTAQDLLGRRGTVDRVDVVLDRGVPKEAARREIAARLPPGLSLEPPGRAAETADRMVRAFRFNLNALGSLTLLVGMFLIANAVSIAVLRRRPEIATLRALGASRAIVFAAFLLEGLAIGAAGTLAGEALGVFAARAALSSVAGTVTRIYLPSARISGAGGGEAAMLAAAVGLAAAVAATLLPALEATRVDPSPAMRAGSSEGAARRRFGWRAAGAAAALVLAAALSFAPPVDGFPLFGFAAVALVVAALAFASPLLVRFVGAVPARLLPDAAPPEARLGAGLFGGSPARNGLAVTALAMALGMTLAMIVTVASIRQTVRIWVEATLRSDLWIKADAGNRSGIVGDLPPDILPFLRGIPGVAAVDPFRSRDAVDEAGRPYTVASGDFGVVSRAGGLPMRNGRDPLATALRARERGEVLASEPFVRRFQKREGDTVALRTPSGQRTLRIAGVYYDYSNDRGTVVMDRALWLRLFGDERLTSAAVLAAPGVDPVLLRRRILEAASGRYALSITTNRELRREVLAIFDRTFAVTRALEGIALAVAVLGVAHALAASAVERRRAFGLLRAVGASGGQIRRATLVEALFSGGAGVLAAIPAGAAFAWLLLAVINPQSFGWTVAADVPILPLAGACALVVLASLAAGIGPGRIAARVEPAAALQEE